MAGKRPEAVWTASEFMAGPIADPATASEFMAGPIAHAVTTSEFMAGPVADTVTASDGDNRPLDASALLWRREAAAAKWARVGALSEAAATQRGWRARLQAVETITEEKLAVREVGPEVWCTQARQTPVRSASSLRHALSRHPHVFEQLKRLHEMVARSCLPPALSGPEKVDTISFLHFLQLHLRLQRALLPHSSSLEHASAHAERDWAAICPPGARSMSLQLLTSRVFFDLADGWTQSTTYAECAAFLGRLFHSIATGSPPSLRPLSDVHHYDLAGAVSVSARASIGKQQREHAAAAAQARLYPRPRRPVQYTRPATSPASSRSPRTISTTSRPFSFHSSPRSPQRPPASARLAAPVTQPPTEILRALAEVNGGLGIQPWPSFFLPAAPLGHGSRLPFLPSTMSSNKSPVACLPGQPAPRPSTSPVPMTPSPRGRWHGDVSGTAGLHMHGVLVARRGSSPDPTRRLVARYGGLGGGTLELRPSTVPTGVGARRSPGSPDVASADPRPDDATLVPPASALPAPTRQCEGATL